MEDFIVFMIIFVLLFCLAVRLNNLPKCTDVPSELNYLAEMNFIFILYFFILVV